MDNNGVRESLAKWLEEAGKMAGKVKENTVNTMEQVKAQTTEFQRKTQEFLESGNVTLSTQLWCADQLPSAIAGPAMVVLEATREACEEHGQMMFDTLIVSQNSSILEVEKRREALQTMINRQTPEISDTRGSQEREFD